MCVWVWVFFRITAALFAWTMNWFENISRLDQKIELRKKPTNALSRQLYWLKKLKKARKNWYLIWNNLQNYHKQIKEKGIRLSKHTESWCKQWLYVFTSNDVETGFDWMLVFVNLFHIIFTWRLFFERMTRHKKKNHSHTV